MTKDDWVELAFVGLIVLTLLVAIGWMWVYAAEWPH